MRIEIGSNKRSYFVFVTTIVLLAVVLYFGNMFTFNTSEIIDVICVVAFPFMNVTGILATVAFFIPVNSGISVLYIYGYAILMLVWKRRKISASVLLSAVLVFAYEVVMSLFVPNSNIMNIVIYTITVFLLVYMMNDDEIDYKQSCYAYIAGTIVLLLSVITTTIQNTSLQMLLSGAIRIGTFDNLENLGGRIAIISENANSMAYYALVAIVIAFSLLKDENVFGKIVLIIAMLFSIVAGLFSVSRSFLFVLLFGIFLVFMARYDLKRKVVVSIVMGVVLFIGLPYLIDYTGIFESFTNRFTDTAAVRGSGRIELFVEYMQFLWDNPIRLFFGTGAVHYKDVCQCSNSVHNGLQQILVAYGLIGFIPMIYLLTKPVFLHFKQHGFVLEKIVPLICVIIFTQTLQFLNPFNLMLPYAITIMYMKIPSEGVE